MTLNNKSKIKLVGADQANFTRKLRGPKYPFVAVDEAQAFGVHLEYLIDDVLTPAVADYEDGQIALTGTPGPVPKGYFYRATQGDYGYTNHSWSVYENPYFPYPERFAEELLQKKQWSRSHPTFRREWLGEWCADPDSLVYRYDPVRNKVMSVPVRKDWIYVLGVDLGFSPDPSAFVLTCYSPYDRNLYVLHSHRQENMTVSDIAERIKYYNKQYPFLKVVADAGALGKMIVEELKKRFEIPIEAADKRGKAEFIDILNSDFISGFIKVTHDNDILEDELINLVWDQTKDKKTENSKYPNHLCDALLYNWRYCYNYAPKNQIDRVDPNSEAYIDKWLEQQEMAINQEKMRDSDLYG